MALPKEDSKKILSPKLAFCPGESELELYLLYPEFKLADSRKIKNHLENCKICQDRLEQLKGFYKLLEHEFSCPIPHEVYEMAKKLINL